MSSTNRAAVRAPHDQYFTRWPVALAIVERLRADGLWPTGDDNLRVLESSSGTGAFVGAAAEVLRPLRLVANDIAPGILFPSHRERAFERAGSFEERVGDFLEMETDERFDFIPGNPPYSDHEDDLGAEAHVRKAISLLTPGGLVAHLLRGNFLAGKKRVATLWQEHPPEYVYFLDKRPTFTQGWRRNKKGKWTKTTTDSCEYAVFVFRKERPCFEPVIRWIRWSLQLESWKNTIKPILKSSDETEDLAGPRPVD